MTSRRWLHGMVGVGLLALLPWGCSGGADAGRVSVHPVTGTIKMAGKPVINAIVTYSPEEDDSKLPVAMGRTDNEGKYALTTYDANDGAAAGDYRVMVSKNAASPSTTTTATHDANNPAASSVNASAMHAAARGKGGKGESLSGSLLPEKYGSRATDLHASVKESGENVFDFELQP